MKPEEFCRLFGVCEDDSEWEVTKYTTMDNAWAKTRPDCLLFVAMQPGVLSHRELQLCADQAVQQIRYWLNQKNNDSTSVLDRYLKRKATDAEVENALKSMQFVGRACEDAACQATLVARSAAWAIAGYEGSAQAATIAGARKAIWISITAGASSLSTTSTWIRANTKPNWERARKEGAR